MMAFFLAVGRCTGLLGPATGVSSLEPSVASVLSLVTGGRALVAFLCEDVEGR